jgi:hypothetical protein
MCGQISLNICGLRLDHCIPMVCRGHFFLAAAVRSWHSHASALALHLLATGAFRRSQMCVRQSTGHGWSQ